MDRTRDREDFAPLFQCIAGGDQRAASQRGLDHEDAESEPADEAISARKVRWPRRRAERELREQQSVAGNISGEIPIACRINDIETRTEHRDSGAASLHPSTVRGRVDAVRKTAD